ncbi:TetR/AcrR family transcriptional regulator [Streptomyces griseorubiginosus]|uniref:TetR/AcrR family transcriptional regulator n=1 Tax=Streptomyces griseorubiginosus TaxID=67304 RepID=UPI001FCC6040|nr:TetR/AcrR family transcriptional regulator [Streptomyces griseorubiginosus]
MSDSSKAAARTEAKPLGLRERMRATIRAEVIEAAHRLFTVQGYDRTTVEQIAAEVGLSRASLFRHFGTKEDIVLGHLNDSGLRVAEALAARPEHESPWMALRRAFDVLVRMNEEDVQQTLRYLRMLADTPALHARHVEKQLAWRDLLGQEIARRMGTDPDWPSDPRPPALAAAALACLDAASSAWIACDGAIPLSAMLDRAMDTPRSEAHGIRDHLG